MERVGLLGGTFDPIHFGHLRLGLELREALALDEIRFIPCHNPPHRNDPVASSEQRLMMLEYALKGVPGTVVDSRELLRDEPSYTVDTLALLRQERPDAIFFWFMGMDAFASFMSWYQWEKILTLAHLVVSPRPDNENALPKPMQALLDERRIECKKVNSAESEQQSGGIYIQAITQLDISATRIRSLSASGQPLNYLLPERVRQFIEQEKIYS